jgi:hypothetical protein
MMLALDAAAVVAGCGGGTTLTALGTGGHAGWVESLNHWTWPEFHRQRSQGEAGGPEREGFRVAVELRALGSTFTARFLRAPNIP